MRQDHPVHQARRVPQSRRGQRRAVALPRQDHRDGQDDQRVPPILAGHGRRRHPLTVQRQPLGEARRHGEGAERRRHPRRRPILLQRRRVHRR